MVSNLGLPGDSLDHGFIAKIFTKNVSVIIKEVNVQKDLHLGFKHIEYTLGPIRLISNQWLCLLTLQFQS